MVIAVLGGGASGLMAAIAASKHPGCEVHILERQNRVGRKLLATGNGRCNLTNTGLSQLAALRAKGNPGLYSKSGAPNGCG